jgi:flagellar protein FliO/FliZ
MKTAALAGFLTLAPTLVLAAGSASSEEGLLVPAFKMLGALALVIGLLLLAFAASRKGLSLLPGKRSGQIHIIETRPLGGKKMLCLVQVRGQELLLGVSAERIDCLTQLPAHRTHFQTTLEQLEPRESTSSLEAGV